MEPGIWDVARKHRKETTAAIEETTKSTKKAKTAYEQLSDQLSELQKTQKAWATQNFPGFYTARAAPLHCRVMGSRTSQVRLTQSLYTHGSSPKEIPSGEGFIKFARVVITHPGMRVLGNPTIFSKVPCIACATLSPDCWICVTSFTSCDQAHRQVVVSSEDPPIGSRRLP